MTGSGRKSSTPPTTTETEPNLFSCVFRRAINALRENILNRSNGLYFVIGALLVVVVGLGAYIYREESKPEGVELSIGQNGISVEQK